MTLTALAFLIILIALPVSLVAVKLIDVGYELNRSSDLRKATNE